MQLHRYERINWRENPSEPDNMHPYVHEYLHMYMDAYIFRWGRPALSGVEVNNPLLMRALVQEPTYWGWFENFLRTEYWSIWNLHTYLRRRSLNVLQTLEYSNWSKRISDHAKHQPRNGLSAQPLSSGDSFSCEWCINGWKFLSKVQPFFRCAKCRAWFNILFLVFKFLIKFYKCSFCFL